LCFLTSFAGVDGCLSCLAVFDKSLWLDNGYITSVKKSVFGPLGLRSLIQHSLECIESVAQRNAPVLQPQQWQQQQQQQQQQQRHNQHNSTAIYYQQNQPQIEHDQQYVNHLPAWAPNGHQAFWPNQQQFVGHQNQATPQMFHQNRLLHPPQQRHSQPHDQMSFPQVQHDIVNAVANTLGISGPEPNDPTALEDAELGWIEVIPSSGGGGRGMKRHGKGKKNKCKGGTKGRGRRPGDRDAEPGADIAPGVQAAARGTR